MNFFSDDQLITLFENGRLYQQSLDIVPVAHLLQTELKYQWLITELYESNANVAFGLFSIGDKPVVGEIDLKVIEDLYKNHKHILNNPIFEPVHALSIYADVAMDLGEIATDQRIYKSAFAKFVK